MAGPAEYRILRQTRWGEQTVYMVLHLQQNETFHVIDEPVGWQALGLDHPALPRASATHEGNGIRQTWLPLLIGERLTERRAQGGLTGSEIAGALEAVAAALAHLATHRPEGVPAVVDPDCVCRVPSGEWVVDYAMLAHNPEVRRSRQPAGVYAVGLLFFWLVSGEFPRLGRPALTGRFPPLSTTILLPLVKAINESYPGLPELQQALIDCRRAGGFDRLAEYLSRPAPQRVGKGRHPVGAVDPGGALAGGRTGPVEAGPAGGRSVGRQLRPPAATPPQEQPWVAHDPKAATETLVGLAGRPLAAPPPEIPLRDPSWAPAPWQAANGLPRRPARRQDPPSAEWLRPVLLGTAGAGVLLLVTLAMVRPWAPPGRQPDPFTPAPTPDSPLRSSPRLGDAARLSPWAEDRLQKRWARWQGEEVFAGVPGGPGTGTPTSPVGPGTGVPDGPGTGAPSDPGAPTDPGQPPSDLPPLPAAPDPEPGSLADQDRQAGGRPHLIYVNGVEAGWAWLFPVDGPYISLGAFNDLFHRTLYWVPLPGNRVRILNASFAVETADVQVIWGRLWLRLTPELQRSLGVTLTQSAEGRLFFRVP